jgi:hypothetical protein
MQDQPVMCVVPELGRRELLQGRFDGAHIPARRESGAIRHPEDMRIDGDGRLAECRIEHDAGRFAADARQALECFALGGDFAAVFFEQQTACRNDVFCLGPIKADRLDVVGKTRFAQFDELLRRIGDRKKLARRFVDAHVGRLRRKHDRDQ